MLFRSELNTVILKIPIKKARIICGKQQYHIFKPEALAIVSSEFFESLYFNYDQACDLQSRGHIIGGHGDSHKWLTKLQPDNLSFELTSSLNLIKE